MTVSVLQEVELVSLSLPLNRPVELQDEQVIYGLEYNETSCNVALKLQ